MDINVYLFIVIALAKELISVHKGTITAENSSDKGTVFTILLPKAL